MADIGDVVGRLRLTDEFSVPIAKMQQTLMGLARTFAPAVAGALSIAGAFKVVKDSVDAAANAESVVAQLNSAIISTGGAAGKTTEVIRPPPPRPTSQQDYADRLSGRAYQRPTDEAPF